MRNWIWLFYLACLWQAVFTTTELIHEQERAYSFHSDNATQALMLRAHLANLHKLYNLPDAIKIQSWQHHSTDGSYITKPGGMVTVHMPESVYKDFACAVRQHDMHTQWITALPHTEMTTYAKHSHAAEMHDVQDKNDKGHFELGAWQRVWYAIRNDCSE